MEFLRNAWRKILTEPRQGPKPAAPEFRPTQAHHRFPHSSQNRASLTVFTPQIFPRDGTTTFCPDRDKRLRRFCRDFCNNPRVSMPLFLRFPHENWIGDPPTALSLANWFDRPMCGFFVLIETKGCVGGCGTGGGNGEFSGGRFESELWIPFGITGGLPIWVGRIFGVTVFIFRFGQRARAVVPGGLRLLDPMERWSGRGPRGPFRGEGWFLLREVQRGLRPGFLRDCSTMAASWVLRNSLARPR